MRLCSATTQGWAIAWYRGAGERCAPGKFRCQRRPHYLSKPGARRRMMSDIKHSAERPPNGIPLRFLAHGALYGSIDGGYSRLVWYVGCPSDVAAMSRSKATVAVSCALRRSFSV